MEKGKDSMEQIATEDLIKEVEAIDEEMAGVELEVPAGLKEEMKKRLHAQIDEYEKQRLYAQLSEEDRKALEMGKEMLENKRVYRRKSKKMYVAVAAVAVLVLAMGVTSIGGAERIAKMIGIKVGDREIIRVETDENNYIATNEEEEIAYQMLKDVFGMDVVRPISWPDNAEFISVEIDSDLQTALLKYEYQENIISYFVSSHHTKSSWGFDVEDKVTDQYIIKHEKCEINIKEYETPESKEKIYSAGYTYKDMEYCLIGIINRSDFEKLVKNLIFF